MRNTLGKTERLKSKKIIESLFNDGIAIKTYPIILIFRIQEHPGDSPVQMAATASKRSFPHATDRNRLKRLIRESYRINKHELYEYLESRKLKIVLIVMCGGKEMLEYDEIHEKIKRCLMRLIKEELPKFQP